MTNNETAQLLHYKHLYINGEWVEPEDGGMLDSIDPATGKPWAIVAYGGKRDIDKAVAAARSALDGPWGKMPGHERAELLRKLADIYKRRAPELARLESRDSGRALRETIPDINAHSNWYMWYASLCDKIWGRTIPMDDSVHIYTSRLPVGVVGAITPWNAPMLTTAWKLGPALAAGCTVILKPAELTPVTAIVLASMIEEAGFPAGVVNVVPGYGQNGAGQYLTEHPGVDKIAFTGEGKTARTILKAGADSLKKFSFELGGKAPHIIFADANLDSAINAATSSAWAVCGQSCALGSRVLVEKTIYDQVVDAFIKRQTQVRIGMPLNERTHMGPQASAEQLAKTMSYIESGRQEGADLVAGGSQPKSQELADGFFIEPTVFASANNNMRIAREEIFGPVAALIPFEGEEEAIHIANDTTYGLTAGLWSQDIGKAHRVAAKIRAGMVWVNTYRYIRWTTPYGGFKASGWGRENGIEALDSYLETRTTVVSTTAQFQNPYND
ncbi:aldehyde dehydrogenase [Alcaligenaceae bacterium]|nr:aldehyde dehydrogenase [Alcaligenaceae bacterium]